MKNNYLNLVFETVLEYFLYQEYFLNQYQSNIQQTSIAPPYYYIHKTKKNLLFSPYKKHIIIPIDEPPDNILEEIVTQIHTGNFSYREYILSYDERYEFLFSVQDAGDIVSKPKDKKNILELLNEDPNNLIALEGYVNYAMNRGCQPKDIRYIEKICQIDPLNPFFQLVRSRYFASVLYKYTKNHLFVQKAKNIFNNFECEISYYPFTYYWGAWIYFIAGEYEKTQGMLNTSISLNKASNIDRIEPYIIQLRVLSKKGDTLGVIQYYQEIMTNEKMEGKEEKIDFTVYKILSEALFHENDFQQSLYMAIEMIKNFMNRFSIDIEFKEKSLSLSTLDIELFSVNNLIPKFSSEKFENILYLLGYLKKKNTIFLNSRGIENICLALLERKGRL